MESAYLQAIRCKPSAHIPIWFMRQAGRYMQSFRKLREKHTFLELVRTPELAAEVTLQPIKAFGFDAAILFSDILVLADAFDLDLTYQDKLGPRINRRLMCSADLQKISLPAAHSRLDYVFSAIKCTKQKLQEFNTPLIGFAGAPFTVASYMVGPNFNNDPKKICKWCLQHLDFLHEVLELLTKATIAYLKAQVQAGADALQIFESWNSWLSWTTSKELSVFYIEKIIKAIKAEFDVPITVFGTANSSFYSQFASSGMDAISFDAKIDLKIARQNLARDIAIQGNLDAHFLLGQQGPLMREVDRLLESMQGQDGFIFNLGHGILPETPEDNVKLVIERVQSFKQQYANIY